MPCTVIYNPMKISAMYHLVLSRGTVYRGSTLWHGFNAATDTCFRWETFLHDIFEKNCLPVMTAGYHITVMRVSLYWLTVFIFLDIQQEVKRQFIIQACSVQLYKNILFKLFYYSILLSITRCSQDAVNVLYLLSTIWADDHTAR